jgi:hypothetical protein
VQQILDAYPLGATAYNKGFDFSYLSDRGLSIRELECPMILSTDVCKLPSRPGYNQYKWPTVEQAYDHFFPGNQYQEAHRVFDDAMHEAQIVKELYERGIFQVPGYQKEHEGFAPDHERVVLRSHIDEANFEFSHREHRGKIQVYNSGEPSDPRFRYEITISQYQGEGSDYLTKVVESGKIDKTNIYIMTKSDEYLQQVFQREIGTHDYTVIPKSYSPEADLQAFIQFSNENAALETLIDSIDQKALPEIGHQLDNQNLTVSEKAMHILSALDAKGIHPQEALGNLQQLRQFCDQVNQTLSCELIR